MTRSARPTPDLREIKDVTMAILGTMLKYKRAGEAKLAWNSPALAGPDTIVLRSADIEHDGTIPMGCGYQGTEPIKGHGVHRYVFELFALATLITSAVGLYSR
jgi:phosphatidylethanolamine-binding protein (PEBP) family uncharacterized protein